MSLRVVRYWIFHANRVNTKEVWGFRVFGIRMFNLCLLPDCPSEALLAPWGDIPLSAKETGPSPWFSVNTLYRTQNYNLLGYFLVHSLLLETLKSGFSQRPGWLSFWWHPRCLCFWKTPAEKTFRDEAISLKMSWTSLRSQRKPLERNCEQSEGLKATEKPGFDGQDGRTTPLSFRQRCPFPNIWAWQTHDLNQAGWKYSKLFLDSMLIFVPKGIKHAHSCF